ncbi:MAG TPA: DUF4097 family beta strand repeat-containing protein [Thermoanaerobaculia bacterium]|jgi:DUF4097 and DUF4098 domain-containing protein YvlB|nr:DUF4097 family beta strand repeat-containing protein [Thermoanaerobaculia bacterium]
MKRSLLSIIAILLGATAASAATFAAAEVYQKSAPIDGDGQLIVVNPFGDIEVVGVDGLREVAFTVRKSVTGVDDVAIKEGRELTALLFDGDNKTRVVKTGLPLMHDRRWASGVDYTIHVPKTIRLHIEAHTGQRIHVANISGAVWIKNVNGVIDLDNVTGAVAADSANGSVVYETIFKPTNEIRISTVNGNVELDVPADSSFKWAGQTLRGDFFATIPSTGRFAGAMFHGAVNGEHGPQVNTTSLMGNVYVLRRGTRAEDAQSMRAAMVAASNGGGGEDLPRGVIAKTLQVASFDGDLIFSTPLGNISVGQVRGAARVETRAGEVHLGSVQSQCDIVSLGGPVTLGEVRGPLTARTTAGDVLINAAHQGAVVSTGGGMIRMLYAAGPTNLHSAGGDIVVRQATGPISAETRSGDVTIVLDPIIRSAAVDAKSSEGNVTLYVNAQIAADIDATLLTSDPDANSIRTDFPGLTIHREQIGKKTRIRATGKVNGGGDRVSLYAEDGDITIRTVTNGGVGVSSPAIHP